MLAYRTQNKGKFTSINLCVHSQITRGLYCKRSEYVNAKTKLTPRREVLYAADRLATNRKGVTKKLEAKKMKARGKF